MFKAGPARPRKIAVLGGGISSLTAVFDLTSSRDWKSNYDITVYQMGWRLGGKGASSRNPDVADRIEEHGLHIWLGFYENAFEILRRAYAELPSGAGTFSGVEEAFLPHNFVVLEEKTTDGWLHWPRTFPTNNSFPGLGSDLPSLWDLFLMLLQEIEEFVHELTTSAGEPEVDNIDLSSWSAAIVKDDISHREASLPTPVKLARAARKSATPSRTPAESARETRRFLCNAGPLKLGPQPPRAYRCRV